MPGPTVIDLAMLSRQRLASEVRQHLSRGAFLAPGPFLNGEQNVVVQADCRAHARDASARMQRVYRILEIGRQISIVMPQATLRIANLYADEGMPA